MIPTNPEEWVKGSKVRINMSLSGDRNLWSDHKRWQNKRFIGKELGGRAALERSTSVLLHEFAHFIETEQHRFVKEGYGLRVREVEVCGQVCLEPLTAQATLREIRVMGMQAVLGEHFGCPYNIRDDLAVLVKWLPDWCPAYCHFNLSVAETEGMSLRERDDLLYRRVTLEIQREMSGHTVEGLFKEFRRRCAVHDNYVGLKMSTWEGADNEETQEV